MDILLNIILTLVFMLMLYLATMQMLQYLSTTTPTMMKSSTSSGYKANIYLKN